MRLHVGLGRERLVATIASNRPGDVLDGVGFQAARVRERGRTRIALVRAGAVAVNEVDVVLHGPDGLASVSACLALEVVLADDEVVFGDGELGHDFVGYGVSVV